VPVLVLLAGCAGTDTSATSASTTTTHADTSASTTTTAPPTPGSAALFDSACAGELTVTPTALLPADLSSISGLAASRRRDDLLWAVEDSFEPADLVALDPDGNEMGRVAVRAGPLSNLDWEALATFVDAEGTARVVIGDLGDNLGIRPSVRLMLADEPDPSAGSLRPRVLQVTYPDRARTDAEAMTVHRDNIWVMDKALDRPTTLYRLPLEVLEGDADTAVFESVGTFDLDGERVTALDVSPDGAVLALRTSRSLRLYRIDPGADVAEVLTTEPCVAPAPPEAQGESVALLAGDAGIVTVSEDEAGGAVPLHRIRRG
jgi:hypothetical protein